jgi:ABC-type branched-subunit amino acid transport system substrate-binding protein
VIGHYLDETTEAAQDLYVGAGIPLVVAGTVQSQAERSADLWCPLLAHLVNTRHLADGSGEIQVQWFTSQQDNSASPDCQDGLSFVLTGQVPPASDVDIVLITQDPVEAGETLTLLRESGWNGLVAGGPALGSPLFGQVADPTGVVFASPYRWPDNAVHDAGFAESYRSLGPHISDPGPFALVTFETTQDLLAAINAAVQHNETPSRQTLAKYLSESSSRSIYVYRWTPGGTLELEQAIALDSPSGD